MEKTTGEVVKAKARAMLGSKELRDYGRDLSKEMSSENAFLAGAIDAMIFDVAAVINARDIPSREERKKLIKDLLRVP